LFVCVCEAYQVEFGEGGAEEGETEWDAWGWVCEVRFFLFDWGVGGEETEGNWGNCIFRIYVDVCIAGAHAPVTIGYPTIADF
jgi:hypothetical protein